MRPGAEYAGGAVAAYAVIARIGRADPHLTVRDLDDDLDRDDFDPGSPVPDRPLASEPSVVEIDGGERATFTERISDQIAGVRESFGMMTFYLFDPESWRH